jgi:hypothetical protein
VSRSSILHWPVTAENVLAANIKVVSFFVSIFLAVLSNLVLEKSRVLQEFIIAVHMSKRITDLSTQVGQTSGLGSLNSLTSNMSASLGNTSNLQGTF